MKGTYSMSSKMSARAIPAKRIGKVNDFNQTNKSIPNDIFLHEKYTREEKNNCILHSIYYFPCIYILFYLFIYQVRPG